MFEVIIPNKENLDEEIELLNWLNEYVGDQYIARSLISNNLDRELFLKEKADWFCFINNLDGYLSLRKKIKHYYLN
jgi:hypothetical protein